jgi:WhiB family redox-sensing transcriptional regulator
MHAIETRTSDTSPDEDRTSDALATEVLVLAALRARGRCRDGHGTLTHLFFSEDLYDVARAKAICGKCPVREVCLESALARQEPWGVWGGELLSSGRIVTNKRPRGRPPRVPRPELVVDEVPVPPHYLEPLERTA